MKLNRQNWKRAILIIDGVRCHFEVEWFSFIEKKYSLESEDGLTIEFSYKLSTLISKIESKKLDTNIIFLKDRYVTNNRIPD